MAMLIGILALQGDFEAHARMLERLGVTEEKPEKQAAGEQWRYVRRREDLQGLDGLIIPGGESTTMLKFLEDEAFWKELQRVVQTRPALGTCAGAILLAREVANPAQRSLAVLDAAVVRNAYGRQIDSSIRCAPSRLPGSNDLEMVFIRAPQFEKIGAKVEVLAEENGRPVLLRDGHILAATFHPELGNDLRVHQTFLEMARARK